jgi:predicted RNase H-like HicB family nuclease
MSSPETEHRMLKVSVPVFLIEEDAQWVAWCPALEVSSYGDTEEEAKQAFEDAVEIFIEETAQRGTLEKELLRMGWTLASADYYPPQVPSKTVHALGQSKKVNRTITIPAVRPNPRSGLYM